MARLNLCTAGGFRTQAYALQNVESIKQTGITLPKEDSQTTGLIPDIKLCILCLGHTWLTDGPKLSTTQVVMREVTMAKWLVM